MITRRNCIPSNDQLLQWVDPLQPAYNITIYTILWETKDLTIQQKSWNETSDRNNGQPSQLFADVGDQ